MIRKINSGSPFEHRHIHDVRRIQALCLLRGYEADLDDCADIWDKHSEMHAAGWLGLPEDDNDLWNTISSEVDKWARVFPGYY